MFSIATFNVNSMKVRFPIVRDWLKAAAPDVVAFQELKGQEEIFPREELQELGYESCVHGQKTYNGVAIISRLPVEEMRIPETGFCAPGEARIIMAKVAGIWVVNTYVPQGQKVGSEKFTYKLDFLRGMGEFLEEEGLLKERTIWLGDLNVAPDERDVHDPERLRGEVGFHPDEQEALRVASRGLEDVFRRHVTEGGHYTFWDYRVPNGFKRNLGWRIDHILATEELAQRSLDSRVDRDLRALEKPSDHAPLVATFDI